MIYLERSVKEFLATMCCLFVRGFIIDPDKHFIRERKMCYEDYIRFIFWNNGRNNDIETTEFLKVFLNKKYETVSHQAIGKQRLFIKPELFINIYKRFINKIYHDNKHFSDFKGYIVGACDSSIFDLPNVTLTREEFKIKDKTIFNKPRVRARVSGILDVNSKLMLTTRIVERSVKETTLAMEHLLDLKHRLGVEKLITIYDRGYSSVELMLFTEKLNSKFLIRLTKKDFISQRNRIMGNDKYIYVNLTNAKIKNFDNEDLKVMARKMGRYRLRIVEIKLVNGTTEILATNLDSDEFSIEDLKELYGQRWSIETGFKKLKSQIMIERFSGHKRIIIEQDFYASILIYNLATAIQWDGQQRMEIKHRNGYDKFICKPVFSSIVGIMYVYLEDVLSSSYELVDKSISFLIEQASRLYYQKNRLYLALAKMKKIFEDMLLQLKWGGEWEKHKSDRKLDDPTNDHPGNPKPTH